MTCCLRAAQRCIAVTVLSVVLGVAPAMLSAQTGSPVSMQQASRTVLAQRAATIEQQLASGRVSGGERSKLSTELQSIRNRLSVGDFRVGDRFAFTIRQDSVRSDTASVRDSLMVSITNLPDVSLQGVLRSELDEKLGAHVARYLRNASVRTNVLTRIAVLGSVGNPGFYYASPDRPISDVVMLAGGPAADANLNELEIKRGGSTLISKKDSKRFIKEGRTLEQLNVESGDEVSIPKKRKINWQVVIQSILVVTSLFFAILQFVQWYANRQDN